MRSKRIIRQRLAGPLPSRLIASFAFLCAVCAGLLVLRVAFSDSLRYTFLFWNLILAIIPALLAWWLVIRVRTSGWGGWRQIALTGAWIGFLPNSFYLITDLIHLRVNYEADLLFDIVLLTSFILAGLLLGYTSIYLVHTEMLKRMRGRWAYGLVAVLFLAVSFAIFLGRFMRWNTWDIILRPAGLLFDISDRLVNVDDNLVSYQITAILFLLLFSGYTVVFEAARLLRANK